MKEPTIILEYRCDGMSCPDTVQFRLMDVTYPIALADLTTAVEAAGCRFLGRNTFFCPKCADPRREAPDCLKSERGQGA